MEINWTEIGRWLPGIASLIMALVAVAKLNRVTGKINGTPEKVDRICDELATVVLVLAQRAEPNTFLHDELSSMRARLKALPLATKPHPAD